MIQGFTHFYPLSVSFDLVDAGNVLYHPNYLVVLDRARAAALKLVGYPFEELWKDGWTFAVRESACEYFRPARMGIPYGVLTELVEVSRTTLTVQQRLVLAEHLPGDATQWQAETLVQGRVTLADPKAVVHLARLRLVCIDLQAFKAVAFPERLAKVLRL